MTKNDLQIVTLEIPRSVDSDEVKMMVYASMFGKGYISSGKAAEYLSISRKEFLETVGQYGVTIFSEDLDDLRSALNLSL